MKMLNIGLRLTLLGVLSVVSMSAYAESTSGQPQIYIGGGIGAGRINGEDFTNSNGDISENRVSWKAQAGLKFNPILSIEAQYIDFGAANRNSDRVKATGWTAGAILDLPTGIFITPYAKVGAIRWETDNRFNNISANESGTDLTWGGGVRFNLSDNLDLRAEYERFRMDSTHVDNISATVQFNF